MWKIYGSSRVNKAFASMDVAVKESYQRGFSKLSKNPKGGKLLKRYDNVRSYPVTSPGGEHRIIYRLKHNDRVVYVIFIGSRSDVYELLKRSKIT